MTRNDSAFIDAMRQSGTLLNQTLLAIVAQVKAGMTGSELNIFAEQYIASHHATPAFKNYQGFPAALCVSINDEVVHGIPKREPLQVGDVVGLDIGIALNNAYTDTASTVIITKDGCQTIEDILSKARTAGEYGLTNAEKLLKVTYESLNLGIDQVKAGAHVGSIGHTIQSHAEKHHYGVIRQLVGHGVGHAVHEEPSIPNFGTANTGSILHAGQTIAIEPMITAGGWNITTDKDGWTVRTADHSLAAHFEHTILVTDSGAEILT